MKSELHAGDSEEASVEFVAAVEAMAHCNCAPPNKNTAERMAEMKKVL